MISLEFCFVFVILCYILTLSSEVNRLTSFFLPHFQCSDMNFWKPNTDSGNIKTGITSNFACQNRNLGALYGWNLAHMSWRLITKTDEKHIIVRKWSGADQPQKFTLIIDKIDDIYSWFLKLFSRAKIGCKLIMPLTARSKHKNSSRNSVLLI